MHVLLAVFVIWSVWKWADVRRWKEYHNSMLFIAVINLSYLFLCDDYYVWSFESDALSNDLLTNIIHTFVILPATAFLFLSCYPDNTNPFYYIKWISLYMILEAILTFMGYLSYDHGWNLWWSLLFYIMMFPILRLHFKKPINAYVVSIVVIMILLWIFKVPVDLPLEKR